LRIVSSNVLSSTDLNCVEAIARHGSLAVAARELKRDPSTLFRWLKALEARLGTALFARHDGRYVPSQKGAVVVEAARRWSVEVRMIEREIAARDPDDGARRVVRITTTEDVAVGLLPAWLSTIAHQHPGIQPEVIISGALLDLERGEADVAIRPTRRPPPGLVGKDLGPLRSAVYERATPSRRGGQEVTRWLAWRDAAGPVADHRWLARRVAETRTVARFDSMLAMHAATRAGLGAAVLPCFVGDNDPTLRRVGEPVARLQSRLYLLCAPAMRRSAAVAAVFRAIPRLPANA
jgi:DNA-binding transcriptional LysR family regulator